VWVVVKIILKSSLRFWTGTRPAPTQTRCPPVSAVPPDPVQESQHQQRVRVLAMQHTIDGHRQIGIATGIQMARRDLTAQQARAHLTGVAATTGVPLPEVPRVVVADHFPG
jgi:hypothetical protein